MLEDYGLPCEFEGFFLMALCNILQELIMIPDK